ncbi:MAG: ACT domain-containing protein [Actinomycetota bacterium]
MASDITIVLPDRPGVGAQVCKALGDAGINIEGACGFPSRGQTWGVFHLLVSDGSQAIEVLAAAGVEVDEHREVKLVDIPDGPGALYDALAEVAATGANIDLIYFASRDRLVIGTEDMHAPRVGVNMTDARR